MNLLPFVFLFFANLFNMGVLIGGIGWHFFLPLQGPGTSPFLF